MTPAATPEALAEALAEFQRRNGYHRPEIEELLTEFGELVLATATAAHHQVTAERDADQAELARLRAEGEAKDRALKDLRADANALGARLGNTSQYDDPKALRDLCWEAGNFLARRIVRPALARAATAREMGCLGPASAPSTKEG
ncbi:hypothetical protein [Methylorubrum thiocyanatum]|uniref:hypothetical protein n=1 Tax=Methylorubrum thiocyanatum TaxID=47958 RepID=UPI0035C78C08